MSVVPAKSAIVHDLHGARFTSFVAPARGSLELCAWRLEIRRLRRLLKFRRIHECQRRKRTWRRKVDCW